jgi:tartrate dehydratase alpha subunit/fumarate hydratase class I-like protein
MERVITLPATTQDIAESLSSAKISKTEKSQSRMLSENTQFLARQGLPLCGDRTG